MDRWTILSSYANLVSRSNPTDRYGIRKYSGKLFPVPYPKTPNPYDILPEDLIPWPEDANSSK